MIFKAFSLAWRDYLHEGLLSACAVLSLAAVLAPLLVLYGVKFGIVTTMTDRLKNNPRNLEISPIASGHFTPDALAEIARLPGVAFLLPRTRTIAATMQLSPQDAPDDMRRRALVSLEPTASGDPLLARHTPVASLPEGAFPVVLSDSAARKLGVRPGDMLHGRVERRLAGKTQAARAPLAVSTVLPLEAQQKDVAFVPLELLEAAEDFRDGRAPFAEGDTADPRLSAAAGWTGEARPAAPRVYPGFRLYARTLEDVEGLRRHFEQRGVEVYTHAEEIAAISSLDVSLSLIFYLVGAAAALGFAASTASNALAGVRRKERHLGILRLVGYPASAIMAFPLFQGMLTALLGTGLASGLYFGAALTIDHLFAHSLQDVESICTLLPRHFALALGLVLGLTLLATLQPAARAACVEPSEVIRDV